MQKILKGRNYGSIPHLSDSKLGEHDKYAEPGQEKIIRTGGRDKHDRVFVSLKLDGTNVGVLRDGDELIPVQRKGFHCDSSPYEQHHKFSEFVTNNKHIFLSLLQDGERVAGEWLYQASGIMYNISGHPFFPFDLFTKNNERISIESLQELINNKSPFQVPPFLDYGFKEDMQPNQDTYPWLESLCLATPIREEHEGLVYRVERKGKFDFMAKWVRQDFIPGQFLPGVRDNPKSKIILNTLK